MNDFDLILHERIRQNGSEYIVKKLIALENYETEMKVDYERWSLQLPTDSEIRFEASRCAFRLTKRHKR